MGTRSTTRVLDEQGNVLVNLYSQFDGYPSGHGAELVEFLSKGPVINGIGPEGSKFAFNGMGCLAARLVANFKKGIGGFYIVPSDQREEFNYVVSLENDGKLHLRILDNDVVIFKGPITQFQSFLENNP